MWRRRKRGSWHSPISQLRRRRVEAIKMISSTVWSLGNLIKSLRKRLNDWLRNTLTIPNLTLTRSGERRRRKTRWRQG
jgi:hypothetical protein